MSRRDVELAIDKAIRELRADLVDAHVTRGKPLDEDARASEEFVYYSIERDYDEAARNADYRVVRDKVARLLSDSGLSATKHDPLEFGRACHRYLLGAIESIGQYRRFLTDGTPLDLAEVSHSVVTTQKQEDHGEMLSVVLDAYYTEHATKGSWTPRSETKYKATLRDMLEIVGDRPIAELSHALASDFMAVMKALPPNPRKSKAQQGRSLRDIAESNEGGAQSAGTINTKLDIITSFFTWAVRRDYCKTNPFSGMSVKDSVRDRDKRAAFSSGDLQRLMSTESYINHRFEHPFCYWLPIIGLFTGMRLEEICQLYLDDIQDVEGTWCIRVSDERPTQSVKTDSSRRVIPVHSKLIELGLLTYVDGLRDRGEERLFPELKFSGDRRYGEKASKWFSSVRRPLGLVNQKPKKDFHSFRTTVIDTLKREGVSEIIAGAIAGHRGEETITYGRYGGDVPLKDKRDALELLRFDAELKEVKPFTA